MSAKDTAAKTEQKKSALELLEEDDEFEEFEGTNWEDFPAPTEENQLWQDDWDDDDVNDDFTAQLRAQIGSVASNGENK